jgi:hypothetical protein
MYNEKAFDDAVSYLSGSGQLFGPAAHRECVGWLKDKGFSERDASVAACVAAKACGVYLKEGFLPAEWPEFSPDQISVGDTVYGGRTVYDEYAWMSGVVVGKTPWRAGSRTHWDIKIKGVFAGYSGTEEIGLDSIYRVDKAKVEPMSDDHVQCWECGCEVHVNEATYDGNGWYCGC